MPRRVVPYVRRHPYQAAANGIAYAAGLAYRNRGAIRGAYNRAANYMRRPPPRRSGVKRRSRSRAPASKRRRVAGRSGVSTGHTLQRRSSKIRLSKKIPTRKLALTGFQPFERTFVGLTNFDVDTGKFLLRNALVAGVGGNVCLPIHCIELTSFNNTNVDPVNGPVSELQFDTAAVDASIVTFLRAGTTASGAAGGTAWQTKRGDDLARCKKLVLSNTKISMNLYGARVRDTKFQCHLVAFSDERMNPLFSPDNLLAQGWLDNLSKPLMYSNLRQQLPGWKRGSRILKSWTYNVPAMESSDLNTATGKIVEAHININHNKVMDMTNSRAEIIGADLHDNDAGFAQIGLQARNQPRTKDRLYLYITAFAPERVAEGAETSRETPSFDLVVNQRWMLPPKN